MHHLILVDHEVDGAECIAWVLDLECIVCHRHIPLLNIVRFLSGLKLLSRCWSSELFFKFSTLPLGPLHPDVVTCDLLHMLPSSKSPMWHPAGMSGTLGLWDQGKCTTHLYIHFADLAQRTPHVLQQHCSNYSQIEATRIASMIELDEGSPNLTLWYCAKNSGSQWVVMCGSVVHVWEQGESKRKKFTHQLRIIIKKQCPTQVGFICKSPSDSIGWWILVIDIHSCTPHRTITTWNFGDIINI